MDFVHIPNVSLRQLQYIVAVADLSGFRRAADGCRVAQPSLSVQVAQAERALGVHRDAGLKEPKIAPDRVAL